MTNNTKIKIKRLGWKATTNNITFLKYKDKQHAIELDIYPIDGLFYLTICYCGMRFINRDGATEQELPQSIKSLTNRLKQEAKYLLALTT